MDPLSMTASVIAVATLAAQSCKITYSLIDELVGAPQIMSNTKSRLLVAQKTFDSLQQNLEQNSITPQLSNSLESFLGEIPLKDALYSAQGLCGEFSVILKQCTKHSTDGSFSTRDRLTVSLHESKIQRYNKQLSEYQQTVNAVVESIILHITSDTSRNVERLGGRFRAQEQTLVNLSDQLRSTETSLEASNQTMTAGLPKSEISSASEDSENALGIQRTKQLRELCEEILAMSQKGKTGQKFDEALTEDGSIAFQGISGAAQPAVEQSFGKLTTQKNSRAAQGQISSEDFGKLFA